ncbi:brachyurin-like [Battus philenor]|uniref:brachyurin-like n=1 Tax=Battus philenor TaxID=42288 RepID=UPI0035CFF072
MAMMLFKIVFLYLFITSSALDKCTSGDCVGKNNENDRIMGGIITEPNSRPFQVALYLRVGTTGDIGFCGGSLVHREWVLTAAHCCFHDDQLVDHVQAILGAHSLYDRYENGRRIVNVDEVVVHPDWEPVTFANDLALLHLANVIQLTDKVNTIRLPYLRISSFNFAGMGAIASGWGIAADGVTFVSPTLREKFMTVITNRLCNISFFNQLPENIICGFSTSAGTCKGDNGGPLTIFFNATEEVILVGVATFVGADGCSDDIPSVFTRVQRYLNWISDVTGIVLD